MSETKSNPFAKPAKKVVEINAKKKKQVLSINNRYRSSDFTGEKDSNNKDQTTKPKYKVPVKLPPKKEQGEQIQNSTPETKKEKKLESLFDDNKEENDKVESLFDYQEKDQTIHNEEHELKDDLFDNKVVYKNEGENTNVNMFEGNKNNDKNGNEDNVNDNAQNNHHINEENKDIKNELPSPMSEKDIENNHEQIVSFSPKTTGSKDLLTLANDNKINKNTNSIQNELIASKDANGHEEQTNSNNEVESGGMNNHLSDQKENKSDIEEYDINTNNDCAKKEEEILKLKQEIMNLKFQLNLSQTKITSYEAEVNLYKNQIKTQNEIINQYKTNEINEEEYIKKIEILNDTIKTKDNKITLLNNENKSLNEHLQSLSSFIKEYIEEREKNKEPTTNEEIEKQINPISNGEYIETNNIKNEKEEQSNIEIQPIINNNNIQIENIEHHEEENKNNITEEEPPKQEKKDDVKPPQPKQINIFQNNNNNEQEEKEKISTQEIPKKAPVNNQTSNLKPKHFLKPKPKFDFNEETVDSIFSFDDTKDSKENMKKSIFD